ncbi:YwaF family protein [Streptococcus cuniculipharyngis]|nr:TIGR02206 family membrane protein [Streptococcus cuniculipharyngis]
MLAEFFTDHMTQEPHLRLEDRLLIFLFLVVVIYLTSRWYQKPCYLAFFRWLQMVQIISLYSWYLLVGWPLSESLPLYHCRLAMFVLLWGREGRLKAYFACLGLIGSVVALTYPVLDPFQFPHLTFFSFVIGHYALAANALMYLLSHQADKPLPLKAVFSYTLMMNGLILMVNLVLGGNYGFLSQLPLIHSNHLVFNFLLMTSVQVIAIWFINDFFHGLEKHHAGFQKEQQLKE